jgi:hypothetical protein
MHELPPAAPDLLASTSLTLFSASLAVSHQDPTECLFQTQSTLQASSWTPSSAECHTRAVIVDNQWNRSSWNGMVKYNAEVIEVQEAQNRRAWHKIGAQEASRFTATILSPVTAR